MTYNPGQQYREASFGGCEFCVIETRDQFGHRTAIHEYPERDIPWTETLGRQVRVFRMRGAIWGETHVQETRDLIEKAECGNPELLVHPVFGEINCILVQCNTTHNPEGRAGETQLDLQFVEAGEFTYLEVTEFQGRSIAGIAPDIAETVFGTLSFPATGLFDTGLFAQISGLAQILRGLFNQSVIWSGNTVEIAALLDQAQTNPQSFTDDAYRDLIRRAIESLYADAQTPAQALSSLCSLMDYNVTQSAPECEYALYVRLLAITYGAQAGIDSGYTNPVQAIGFMECLLDKIERDAEIAAVKCFDQIYDQLETLSSSIAKDYKFIAIGLPPILSARCGNAPSLVTAYSIFGNLNTLDSFEALNAVQDSMFMPADVLYQAQ